MTFRLDLPKQLRDAGWKVKIFELEGPEKPHVTVYRKMEKWRVSLRDGGFLEKDHKWSQIPDDVQKIIEDNWETLKKEWDKRHGKFNPISSEEYDKDTKKDK